MSVLSIAGHRALVLGASGFIGRWVVRELAGRGAHVLAHARGAERPGPGQRELFTADLTAPGTVGALVERARPDVVFNLAGYGVAKDETDEALLARLDVECVRELAAALRDTRSDWAGQRLVHPGSALELGPRPSDLDERAPCRPDTSYGRAKLAATELLAEERARGLASLTARAFTVFGPGERDGRLVPTLLAARKTDGPIPLSAGTQARDWIYVEDVGRALVDLAELPAARTLALRYPFDAQTLNLASGALTPVREFVQALAAEFSIARERLAFGELGGLPQEMFHPPVPVERLRQALGWTPARDPALGLARMHARVREGLER